MSKVYLPCLKYKLSCLKYTCQGVVFCIVVDILYRLSLWSIILANIDQKLLYKLRDVFALY